MTRTHTRVEKQDSIHTTTCVAVANFYRKPFIIIIQCNLIVFCDFRLTFVRHLSVTFGQLFLSIYLLFLGQIKQLIYKSVANRLSTKYAAYLHYHRIVFLLLGNVFLLMRQYHMFLPIIFCLFCTSVIKLPLCGVDQQTSPLLLLLPGALLQCDMC